MTTKNITGKRGQGVLGGLTNNVVGFGVFVLVLALIGIVLVNFQDTQVTGSAAHNITGDGLTGIDTVSGFSNVIAIVLVAGVVLALVGGFFILRGR